MSVLKVAAAQMSCASGLTDESIARHLEAIEDSRAKGVDVLVFPELSLTGYAAAPDLLAQARSARAPELALLAAAAGPMLVAVGFIEEGPAAQFYTAQALLTRGNVVHVHRKINLAGYGRLEEPKHFGRGRSLGTVHVADRWSAATLICADLWNPALPWLAALGGATLLIVPAASSLDAVAPGFDNPGGWDLVLRHTAVTYGMPIVFANLCGGLFWGGSRIVDADGTVSPPAGTEPELVVAEIDYDRVREARTWLPTVRDADPRFVQAELERLMSMAEARAQ
ncbi:MAG TPA: nitrilase-related carbon-nitrogen hydrolase [Hyphomicrobiaceae bacterium]